MYQLVIVQQICYYLRMDMLWCADRYCYESLIYYGLVTSAPFSITFVAVTHHVVKLWESYLLPMRTIFCSGNK